MLHGMARSPHRPPLRLVSSQDDDERRAGELAPHWVPRFAPRRSICDNVFSLARPLWGKPRAEWALCLAEEVVARFPDGDESAAPEWAAGILCVVAVDVGMRDDPELWEHILEDITTMTDVSREEVLSRWAALDAAGLSRPERPPAYWPR